MEIFVGNLDAQTREADLRAFFKGYVKEARYSLRKVKAGYETLFYAIVDIEPEKLAVKAIKKLHAKRINGKPAIVREYQYRSGNNDRRAINWRSVVWDKIERRLTERRQNGKVFARNEPTFTGYDNLAKKGT